MLAYDIISDPKEIAKIFAWDELACNNRWIIGYDPQAQTHNLSDRFHQEFLDALAKLGK